MESAGPSYTTPKNGFDILKPLTNGPNHHIMRKSRRSADLDASYFAKMNDSLDDLVILFTYYIVISIYSWHLIV